MDLYYFLIAVAAIYLVVYSAFFFFYSKKVQKIENAIISRFLLKVSKIPSLIEVMRNFVADDFIQLRWFIDTRRFMCFWSTMLGFKRNLLFWWNFLCRFPICKSMRNLCIFVILSSNTSTISKNFLIATMLKWNAGIALFFSKIVQLLDFCFLVAKKILSKRFGVFILKKLEKSPKIRKISLTFLFLWKKIFTLRRRFIIRMECHTLDIRILHFWLTLSLNISDFKGKMFVSRRGLTKILKKS